MKISKYISALAFLGVLAFNTSSSFADGDYMSSHSKKHKAPASEVSTPVSPVEHHSFESAPVNMKKSGLSSGMTFGIGGNYGFAINSNSDFVIPSITSNGVTTKALTFAQKHDSLYGAYGNLGWMMENGLEANVQVGYDQLKFKDKNNSSNSLENTILSGMLNLIYHVDLFEGAFLPYVTLGAGVARVTTKGTLYDADKNSIAIKDLIKTTFAYQAGAGVATSFENVVLGVGYKFLGVNGYSDVNSDISITIKDPTAANGGVLDTVSLFSYGTNKLNTHNITAFVKFQI